MVRILDIFLYIDRIITKRSTRLGLRQTKSRFRFFFGTDQTHPLSASSGKRFQHNRITYFLSNLLHFFDPLHGSFRSGNDGQPRFTHDFACLSLDPHLSNNIGTGPDKDHSFFFATTGKVGILRQEPISRMNGGSGLFGNGQYQLRLQIRSILRRTGDAISLLRIANMQSSPVYMRVNSHRRNIHHPASTEDAHGYLSTISN